MDKDKVFVERSGPLVPPLPDEIMALTPEEYEDCTLQLMKEPAFDRKLVRAVGQCHDMAALLEKDYPTLARTWQDVASALEDGYFEDAYQSGLFCIEQVTNRPLVFSRPELLGKYNTKLLETASAIDIVYHDFLHYVLVRAKLKARRQEVAKHFPIEDEASSYMDRSFP